MTLDWQNAATAAIVLLALGYFARYLLRLTRRRGSAGCRCCAQCPADTEETGERPLVCLNADIRPPPPPPGDGTVLPP
jgi:hypothetical protein